MNFYCPYCNTILSFDDTCTFNWYRCNICGGMIDMTLEPIFVVNQ